jgi:lipopolysaccharide transport system permease protein
MHITIIDAKRPSNSLAFREIWQRRELLYLMVRRHLSTRYSQMALGSLWAILEPLAQLLLMTIVFGLLLRVDSQGYPYPVFAFAALAPWYYFSRTTMAVAGCLQENMVLISKVYFPRLVLALAALMREFVDSMVTVILLVLLAWSFGFPPQAKLLLIPLVMLGIGLAGAGIGLWCAAIMVKLRDIRQILSIALQVGMYATPILYGASLVPAKLLPYYQINPMYWGVETFRWMLLDKPLALSIGLPIGLGLCAAVLVSGLMIFAAFEKETVDVQ